MHWQLTVTCRRSCSHRLVCIVGLARSMVQYICTHQLLVDSSKPRVVAADQTPVSSQPNTTAGSGAARVTPLRALLSVVLSALL
jgi:hypothetical protein